MQTRLDEAVRERILSALVPFGRLFDAYGSSGFRLYAVGGCVRDWLLGRKPKDVDFATDALPGQTREVLRSCGMKVIPVGEAFGTCATIIGHRNYEITTFRVKESYTRGSRHPVVCYGHDLAQDLERRDLTINAMAVDRQATLFDPFDGYGDLMEGRLRVPRSSYERSAEIFGDDPLRILRLARFCARLGFTIDPDATRAGRDCAGTVLEVSHERWFAELDGLLGESSAVVGLKWLDEIGVLGLLMPELMLTKQVRGVCTSLSGGGIPGGDSSLFEQAFARVEAMAGKGMLPWSGLFSLLGYGVSMHGEWAEHVTRLLAHGMMGRLKFSNANREHVLRLLTPLPAGEPAPKSARLTAMALGQDLGLWLEALASRGVTLPADVRPAEQARLESWCLSLAPYVADPDRANVVLPGGLSARLGDVLGVRGKTLGLCLRQCQEAVLNGELQEGDGLGVFVAWAQKRFEACPASDVCPASE